MQKIINEHQDWLGMQNGRGNWNTHLHSRVCWSCVTNMMTTILYLLRPHVVEYTYIIQSR
jgi:hypothetical protein